MISLQKTKSKLDIAKPYYHCASDEIKNVCDLHTEVKKLQAELSPYKYLWKNEKHHLEYGIYFRGLSNYKDKLIPKIGRPIPRSKPKQYYSESQERNLLHRFRRRSYYHLQRTLDTWEVLFLGRHFGLPTRLLDWTSGMYVALYFACEDYLDSKKGEEDCKDGTVWALVRQPNEDYDLNVFYQPPTKEGQLAGESQFLIKGVKLIYPFYVSPRMTAQASIFTIQDKPKEALEKYPYGEYGRKNFDVFHIRKWKVPKDKKKAIIEELEDIGIDKQTLFPDFSGLAEGIEQIENIR